MQLFLIRHGQSYNNALTDQTQRVADPELTESGVEQARLVAAYLGDGGHLQLAERNSAPNLDELYCSPMVRTLATAKPITTVLGITPRVWIDVHEIGGIFLDDDAGNVTGFPGCSRGQIEERFAGYECDSIGDEGWWHGSKESPEQGRGRAVVAARVLACRASESVRIGVVTHGDFMSAMIKALTDHLPSWGLQYHHENTAISRIDLNAEGGTEVIYLNRATHLPDSLTTTFYQPAPTERGYEDICADTQLGE